MLVKMREDGYFKYTTAVSSRPLREILDLLIPSQHPKEAANNSSRIPQQTTETPAQPSLKPHKTASNPTNAPRRRHHRLPPRPGLPGPPGVQPHTRGSAGRRSQWRRRDHRLGDAAIVTSARHSVNAALRSQGTPAARAGSRSGVSWPLRISDGGVVLAGSPCVWYHGSSCPRSPSSQRGAGSSMAGALGVVGERTAVAALV